MHRNHEHHGFIFLGPILTGMLVFSGMAFGSETEKPPKGEQVSQKHSQSQAQQDIYGQQVAGKLHKAEELLTDLLERAKNKTGEERENLTRTATKLNADLDHAKRTYEHLNIQNPEPWLRNKTEMDAVLADLNVTYDRALQHQKEGEMQN